MKSFRKKHIAARKQVCPLSMACCGVEAHILHMSVGSSLQQKLTSMGLNDGVKIKVLKNECGGPVLLGIGDTRLVIGQGMAQKIMIHL